MLWWAYDAWLTALAVELCCPWITERHTGMQLQQSPPKDTSAESLQIAVQDSGRQWPLPKKGEKHMLEWVATINKCFKTLQMVRQFSAHCRLSLVIMVWKSDL